MFADLSFNRNYLWKKELKRYFPKKYVISSIFDEKLPKELRSAFCRLSSSLYIDHEPFFPAIVPNMCRIFLKNSENAQLSSQLPVQSSTLQMGMTSLFSNVRNMKNPLEAGENVLKTDANFLLYKEMILKITDFISNFGENARIDEFLCSNLELLFLVIRLDMITLISPTKEDYRKIVRNVIFMLEFDAKDLKLTQVLVELRRKREEKALNFNNEHYLKNLHKNLYNIINLKSVFQNLGEFAGFMTEKAKKTSERHAASSSIPALDSQLESNPIIKGLFQMVHSLRNLEENAHFSDETCDIRAKLKILDLLEYFCDIRQDSLISSFVDWFTLLARKLLAEKRRNCVSEEELQKIVMNHIENDYKTRLPQIFLTGIEEIDEKNCGNGISDIFNLKKIIIGKAAQAFEVVADLNQFFTPEDSKEVSILPSLLLLFYRNKSPEVEKKVLRIVAKLYNQREELLHNLLTLEMVFEGKEAAFYAFLQEKIGFLRILVEKSEVWISRFAANPNDPKENDRKTVEIIINLLRNLNLFLFRDSEIDAENMTFTRKSLGKIKRNFGRKIEKNVENEKNAENEENEDFERRFENCGKTEEMFLKSEEEDEDEEPFELEILKERQNLLMFSKGHLPIIALIKDCLHHFPSVVLDVSKDRSSQKLLIELFSMAFLTLRHFCLKNHKNQLILHEFLDVFTEYLQFDLKQISLICAIFQENKALLDKVDSKLVRTFVRLIENEGRQSIFLDFFLIIQQYKGGFLIENQSLVLNTLIPSKFTESQHKILYSLPDSSKILFYFDAVFSADSENLRLFEKLEENGFQDTYRDEPFFYQAKLCEVLIMTTKGSNAMNISVNKLKKLVEIPYLLEILKEKDGFLGEKEEKLQGFSFIKPRILGFLREIHFSGKVADFSRLKGNIHGFIAFETSRLGTISAESLIKNEFYEYFFMDFLGFLLKIYAAFISDLAGNSHSLDLEEMEDYSVLFHLHEALLEKKDVFSHVLLRKNRDLLYNYQKFMEIFDKSQNSAIFPLKLTGKKSIFSRKNGDFDEIPDENGDFLWDFFEKLQISQISSVFLQKTALKTVEVAGRSPERLNADESPLTKTVKQRKEAELTEENLWFFFKNGLNTSKSLLKALDLEKQVLAESFLKLALFTKPEKNSANPSGFSLDVFLRKILDFCTFSFRSPENKDTILVLLQVLKRMIDADKDKKAVFAIQETFRRLEASKMVLAILVDSSKGADTDILAKLLAFSISLLKNGNKNVQKEFLTFFRNLPDSEVLFSKIHCFIRKEIESIESIVRNHDSAKTEESQRKKRGVSKEVFQEIYELARNKEGLVLKKILSFLRLLVEGHNIEMQGYLAKQTNKRNSYDLVTDVVDLCGTYYFNGCCCGLFKNIRLCLETLIGFVEGPCAENQLLVLDSQIMEMVLDIFKQKGNLERNGEKKRKNQKMEKNAKNEKNEKKRKNGKNEKNEKKQKNEENEENGKVAKNEKNAKIKKNAKNTKLQVSSENSQENEKNSALNDRNTSKITEENGSEGPSPTKRNAREKTYIFADETEKKLHDLSDSQVSSLQYKVMVLVMALLEMRNMKESDLVMKKIMQALPLETLEAKMLEIYRDFKEVYSKQYVMAAFGNVFFMKISLFLRFCGFCCFLRSLKKRRRKTTALNSRCSGERTIR